MCAASGMEEDWKYVIGIRSEKSKMVAPVTGAVQGWFSIVQLFYANGMVLNFIIYRCQLKFQPALLEDLFHTVLIMRWTQKTQGTCHLATS